MATCYRCGARNANYRRTTYTGFSSGSWWSKRSYGSGTRTYYGLRSVCENCARSIDQWNRIKLIFWVSVIVIAMVFFWNFFRGPFSAANSSLRPEQTARVISAKGLNLREQPNSSATILLTIPNSEVVRVIDKNGVNETRSGHTANWYKVDYKGTIGWLWSGHLQMQ